MEQNPEFKYIYCSEQMIKMILNQFNSKQSDNTKKIDNKDSILLKNRSYERKGQLYKLSQKSDINKFKIRNFVLLGEQLFYYKNNKKEKFYNLISLQNA